MRILHVMPSVSRAFGGPVEALIGFCQAGQAAGSQTTIVAPGDPSQGSWLAEQLPSATTLHVVPGPGRGTPLPVGMLRWVDRSAREFDVVHVHGCFNLASDLAALLVARREVAMVRRPFGTLSRYTFTHRKAKLKRAYFAALLRRNLGLADRVHFTTSEELEEARLTGIDFATNGEVVPPPIRHQLPNGAATRRRDLTCLYLSRLHPKKNLDALLDAWCILRMRVPDARLVIAGSGDDAYESHLRRRVHALELDDVVELRGFVHGADKEQLLRAARVFVLPSHQENFGVAVLEAMAAGIPVVITPEVQLASFVSHHQLGLIVRPDPSALAAALEAALLDDELLRRCEVAGPATIQEHFSVTAVSRSLGAMYERAIEARRSRSASRLAGSR